MKTVMFNLVALRLPFLFFLPFPLQSILWWECFFPRPFFHRFVDFVNFNLMGLSIPMRESEVAIESLKFGPDGVDGLSRLNVHELRYFRPKASSA